MNAGTLVRILRDAELRGDAGTPITDLAYHSREVTPGALFFCVAGTRADGHHHAAEAVAAGARALVVERWLDLAVAQVRVPSVRAAMGPVSVHFFGHPSRGLTLVGVTGTNGKTTTTYLLEAAFASAGMPAGLIGTVETRIAGDVLPVTRTTPEAPDLQRLLARMREAGVVAAAMEVSSHGLALHRVGGTQFACAVFTNLTQDHLDFHGTIESYFEAKARLFDPEVARGAAVNLDDEFGRRLLQGTGVPATTFAIERPADVRAAVIEMDRNGSSFVAEAGGHRTAVRLRLPGRFNVSNALAAMAVFRALGLPLEAAAQGIAAVGGVPGRFQPVEAGQDFTVLVDYAHTPDSLENVLREARRITPSGGRLACVFGCGGDRDRGKRPRMGRVAVALADRTIISSDNPRSEDPLAIIAAIEAGAREAGDAYEVIPDRREAIRAAIVGASGDDVVVIAGKGHETGQEFADRVVPFDDRVVAREALEELCSR